MRIRYSVEVMVLTQQSLPSLYSIVLDFLGNTFQKDASCCTAASQASIYVVLTMLYVGLSRSLPTTVMLFSSEITLNTSEPPSLLPGHGHVGLQV